MEMPERLHGASWEEVLLDLVPSWVEKGKNRTTFRDNYLNPLKQLGFLALTKPDSPNAPDNKYVITELGKAFLMGA